MTRLLEWLTAKVLIDWSGFAVTRGGLFCGAAPLWAVLGPAEYEAWPHGRPPPPPLGLVASGGVCLPISFGSSDFGADLTWHQWKPWYLRPRYRLSDDLPVVRVERGGITYTREQW